MIMDMSSQKSDKTSLTKNTEAMNSHFLIVDPHPLFAYALSVLLWQCGAQSVHTVVEYTDIIKMAKFQPGTLILFNLSTPGSKGVLGLDRVLRKVDAKTVIVVLDCEDLALENFCIERDIAGIVSKFHDLSQIKQVITAVMQGEGADLPPINLLDEDAGDRTRLYRQITTLTQKETQIFALLKEGQLNKQIAYALEISEATIKYHMSNILRKLNCHSRTQAAVIANRHVFFS